MTLTANVKLSATDLVDVAGAVNGAFNLELAGANGNDVAETIGDTVVDLAVSAGDLAAGTIDITGNLDADTNVSTDTGGVLVNGNVDTEGALTSAKGIEVLGNSELGGDVTANDGDVDLAGSTTLTTDITVNGANVSFLSTLDSDAGGLRALVVNSPGVTTFGDQAADAVGGTDRLASITTDAGGRTVIGTTDVKLNGASATFNDPVLLRENLTIDELGGGNVEFASTVDSEAGSNHSLTINTAAGVTVFGGGVGNDALGALSDDAGLGGLTTNAAGTTQVNGGVVTTTGNQVYGDRASLGANTTLTAADVSFVGGIDGKPAATVYDLTINEVTTVLEGNDVLNGGTASNIGKLTINNPLDIEGTIAFANSMEVTGAVTLTGDVAGLTLPGGLTLHANVAGPFDWNVDGNVTIAANPLIIDTGATGAQTYTGQINFPGRTLGIICGTLDGGTFQGQRLDLLVGVSAGLTNAVGLATELHFAALSGAAAASNTMGEFTGAGAVDAVLAGRVTAYDLLLANTYGQAILANAPADGFYNGIRIFGPDMAGDEMVMETLMPDSFPTDSFFLHRFLTGGGGGGLFSIDFIDLGDASISVEDRGNWPDTINPEQDLSQAESEFERRR